MNENLFSDGVSSIEADVIERFLAMENRLQRKANKPGSNGIWLRLGTIAACTALIVGAMAVVPMLREEGPTVVPSTGTTDSTGTTNRSDTTEEVEWVPPVVEEMAIGTYFGKSMLELPDNQKNPSYACNISPENIGIGGDGKDFTDDAMLNQTQTIGDRVYCYTGSKQCYMDGAKTVLGTFYSRYDRYTAKGGSLVMHRGGRVALWYLHTRAGSISILIGAEEYLGIARPFLRDTFGIEIPEGYEAGEPTAIVGLRSLTLRRTLHGYPTDDAIELRMNTAKQIVYVDAERFGSFDHVADTLTKEQIDLAYATMLEKIAAATDLPQGYTVSEPMLTTSNEGRVFMRLIVHYESDETGKGMDKLWMNVN